MRLVTTLVAFAIVASLLPAAAQAQSVDFKKFIADKAPSIVTVEMVVVTDFNGREMEREVTATGVVVAETGLVMISAEAMTAAQRIRGGFRGRGGRGGGRGGGGDEEMDISSRTENIRVKIPGDEAVHESMVIATDSTLNLAFVQIKNLGDKKLASVPFDPNQKAKIGEELIGVGRHEEQYDHAPYFGTVRITGEIEQPRTMFSFDGRFAGRGIPLFSKSGHAVGVLSTPAPAEGIDSGGGARGGMGMGMGRLAGNARGGAFLIPTNAIHGLITQAAARAKEALKHGKSEPDA